MTRISLLAVVLACAALGACEPARNNSAWPAKPFITAEAATAISGKGVGPVDHIDVASLDETKAPLGEKLFKEKCSACHKIEERYIGPALAGVTERRQPEWILNMILNPEVMIKQDPTAKELFATFLAPMANQHLTRDEAELILTYFRKHDEEASKGGVAEEAVQEKSPATVTTTNGQ